MIHARPSWKPIGSKCPMPRRYAGYAGPIGITEIMMVEYDVSKMMRNSKPPGKTNSYARSPLSEGSADILIYILDSY